MYLDYFKFSEPPFSITPNTEFYCNLPGHQGALNVLLLSLKNGEGFIKIVGEVGSGKTLLCRFLLHQLAEDFVCAYIPNPDLDANGLRRALALELGLKIEPNIDQHYLLDLIYKKLVELQSAGKQMVLLLDEAQAMPDESLEALRLLTNLETELSKLLQVVLFGQPELDNKLKKNSLRQLKQRITFSYYLPPLKRDEMQAYLCHRLAKVGYTYGNLFTPAASKLLFKSSGGLPRLINVLCHKALMVAYGRGEPRVSRKAMLSAVHDTEGAFSMGSTSQWLGLSVLTAAAIIIYSLVKFSIL